jgi:ferredoxin
LITGNTQNQLELGNPSAWPPDWMRDLSPGQSVRVVVGLQQPHVDPRYCIGCGVCEHECPVQGLRAIRVTAENESRSPAHKMISSSGYP